MIIDSKKRKMHDSISLLMQHDVITFLLICFQYECSQLCKTLYELFKLFLITYTVKLS